MIIRQLLKMIQKAMDSFSKSLLMSVVPGAVKLEDSETYLLNKLGDLKIIYAKIMSFKFNVPTENDADMTLTTDYQVMMYGVGKFIATGEGRKAFTIPGLINYPYSNKCDCPKCTGKDPNYICKNS